MHFRKGSCSENQISSQAPPKQTHLRKPTACRSMQKTLKKFLVFENSASIQRNPNKKRVISVFSERFFNRLRPEK